MDKKDNVYVIIIVFIVFAFGFYISSRHPRVEIICPERDALLAEDDYKVNTSNGILTLGRSTWDEAVRIFPEGKSLGKSTVFRPGHTNCLLTFSEDENILIKLHIDDPELPSPRGATVGDDYKLVEAQYGKDYALIKNTDGSSFDMVYGKNRENSVIFKIHHNKVNRIIIQREVQ